MVPLYVGQVPEATHFSLKKRERGLSQVLLCCVVWNLHCLTTLLVFMYIYIAIYSVLYMGVLSLPTNSRTKHHFLCLSVYLCVHQM